MSQKDRIGWIEEVALPEWGIPRLRAKVDTGARTSALHVARIRPLARGRVAFEVVVGRGSARAPVPVVARVTRRARVRSSNGAYETRYFVATTLALGAVERAIELSLVDRSSMTHRMLLGRTAIAGDFVVDVSRRFLLGRRGARTARATRGPR
ncbi:MAG: RimK/LysX family protein [Myxococcota bacterium]